MNAQERQALAARAAKDCRCCPFCGSVSYVFMTDEGGQVHVECGYCRAQGPTVSGDRAADRATMLWNESRR